MHVQKQQQMANPRSQSYKNRARVKYSTSGRCLSNLRFSRQRQVPALIDCSRKRVSPSETRAYSLIRRFSWPRFSNQLPSLLHASSPSIQLGGEDLGIFEGPLGASDLTMASRPELKVCAAQHSMIVAATAAANIESDIWRDSSMTRAASSASSNRYQISAPMPCEYSTEVTGTQPTAKMPCSLPKQYGASPVHKPAISNPVHPGLQNNVCCQAARQK